MVDFSWLGKIFDTGSEIVEGVWDTGSSIVDGVGNFFGDLGFDDLTGLADFAGDLGLTGLQGFGEYEAMQAAIRSGEKAAAIYWANAEKYDADGDRILGRIDYETNKIRYAGQKLLANQQVSYLKSGVTLEGTPLIVMQETLDFVEMEVAEYVEDATWKAQNSYDRAELERIRAEGALEAGISESEYILANASADLIERYLV